MRVVEDNFEDDLIDLQQQTEGGTDIRKWVLRNMPTMKISV